MAEDEDDLIDLPSRAIERLNLSPEVRQALIEIQAEVTAAYRKTLVNVTDALAKQASALDRLQATLQLMIENFAPEIREKAPLALRLAQADETADFTAAVVMTDPMAAGYTLTQAKLSEMLQLPQADVSVLARAFKLADDGQCAVVVRSGSTRMVNYHPRAIDKFRELVTTPPPQLTADQKSALARVKKRLAL